jgi:hypothetical protein
MIKLLMIFTFFSFFALAQEDVQQAIGQESEFVEENFIHNKKNATIQILNKITAKAHYVNIPVKSKVVIGTIAIYVDDCWKSSPYELSENKILLNILEKKIGQKEYGPIFNGWMFSSSPGVSSLEHSVYDVIAINCFGD